MMMIESGYEELGNAVVLKACEDWKKAQRDLRKFSIRVKKAKSTIKEVEEFLRSQDLDLYTQLPGQVILESLYKSMPSLEGTDNDD